MYTPAASNKEEEEDGDMAENAKVLWLSSLSPISESTADGRLGERENRENKIPPMPLPKLAAPAQTRGYTLADNHLTINLIIIFFCNTLIMIVTVFALQNLP